MKTHAHKLDSRELATVLAALRYYQASPYLGTPSDIHKIATNDGEFSSLAFLEVDELCERLNFDGTESPADEIKTLRVVAPALEILPVNKCGDFRTGYLSGISRAEIEAKLGAANIKDDPAKVRWSWGFTVNGVRCGVWDWKRSGDVGEWSTFGPHESLALVFGSHAGT